MVYTVCKYGSNDNENTAVTNKEFLCITRTVRHNYILLISTVRIQLHVSVLYVGHLQVEIYRTYRTETCSCILTVLISKIYFFGFLSVQYLNYISVFQLIALN